MFTTVPLTSNNPFNAFNGVERHLPCSDVSHYQPLFYPTPCHHPHKVLVANLDEGMGTLVHAGSKRNPASGLWPLSQRLVQTVRLELERKASGGEDKEEGPGAGTEQRDENETATSLSAFLGENNDDADWEVVERPAVVKEKFVLVGKREVGDAGAVAEKLCQKA